MTALDAYLAFAAALIALTQFTASRKAMNIFALIHAASAIAFACALACSAPTHFYGNNFLADHLALFEVGIAGFVFLIAVVFAGGHAERLLELGLLDKRNLKRYYLSISFLLTFTVLSFLSNNLALLWIFIELTTFFSAFLIAILNSKKNIDASLKYIFVTSTAMLFSFIGLILLFALTEDALGKGNGTLNWDELLESAKDFKPALFSASFAFLFIGFAAKAGVAPFHTPLPHAYSKAPSAVSTIISAIMLNLGIYGLLRLYAIAAQTEAAHSAQTLLIAFGLLSLFIASLSMLHQRNTKKLIAFSSTEHSGIMLLGLAAGTPAAIFWVLYHTLAHALTKALLFLSTGILQRQYNSNHSDRIVNAFRLQPLASTGLIVGSAAITGIPPFVIFATKLSILAQIARISPALLAAALLFLVIAAASFTRLLADIFTRTSEANIAKYRAPAVMTAPIVILIAAVTIMGLYFPKEIVSLITLIVSELGF